MSTPSTYPVVWRGDILGDASTRRGALRIARRIHIGDTCSEHTVVLRDGPLSEDDILLCRHQLAWRVGSRLRGSR